MIYVIMIEDFKVFFFFLSRRRHTRCYRDWSSDVCSSDLILRPNGAGLTLQAKHPAAALLWMDWVLTDGQKEIAKAFRIPAQTNVPGFTDPIPAGTEVFDMPQDLLVKDSKHWSDAYDSLIRGAPQAQG